MMRASILATCFELARLAETTMPETLAYLKKNGVRLTRTMSDCVGTITLALIADHGNKRFDFDAGGFEALVCDVMGEDGETAVDLIAWPVDDPETVLTMFDRCGLVGAYQAFNPASYFDGNPLPVHRTPLDLFRAGYTGAAVAIPRIAARQILDLPGSVLAVNHRHGIELKTLIETNIRGRVLVPAKARMAA